MKLNETRVNDELINEFIESTNEVTNNVNFCKLLLILSLIKSIKTRI